MSLASLWGPVGTATVGMGDLGDKSPPFSIWV